MKEDTTLSLLEALMQLVHRCLENSTSNSNSLSELNTLLEEFETTKSPAKLAEEPELLTELSEDIHYAPPSPHAHRIYLPEESQRLGKAAQGLLLYLEQTGMLKPLVREAIIEKIMEFNGPVEIPQLKWIILYEFFKHSQSRLQSVMLEQLIQHSQQKLPVH